MKKRVLIMGILVGVCLIGTTPGLYDNGLTLNASETLLASV